MERVVARVGRNGEVCVAVNLGHLGSFRRPILCRILNDTEGIDPQVL